VTATTGTSPGREPGPAQSGEARVIGVALAIPEPQASYLQGLRERFGDPLARSIPTHVTLLPPTTVDDSLLPEIDSHLTEVARAVAPFWLELHGSATFRPVSPVVYVGVADGISGCQRLESAVRAGVLWRPLHFDYHPHVTVAHDLPDDVLDAAAQELADYSAAFDVHQFTRYEHAGGVWVPRRDFVLAGAASVAPARPA
jgi:2'-5' RNA ligase